MRLCFLAIDVNFCGRLESLAWVLRQFDVGTLLVRASKKLEHRGPAFALFVVTAPASRILDQLIVLL
ncbi:MAG: hypothetical protein DMG98_15850 [Acidobacteria bacterium]|nr:MAG: hypothetical protein DMG98_15850 [Acidobacteriota bacterium]